ncbi:MAG: fucose isomerase [Lachnospiraceae bacterium]|nr:fucose isomerase [Lachnospiraceae bacterium]
MAFTTVYVPVGVPTFHLESAKEQFVSSCEMLRAIDNETVCPDDMLLSLDALDAYLEKNDPDLLIFQNLTFANAAYISHAAAGSNCPILLWTLREPVIDGTRLRLNSLTGAYSAANALLSFKEKKMLYVFGAPDEERVKETVRAVMSAARIKKEMTTLKVAAIGHTPQGFGFGRALDAEMMSVFGAELTSIEARELIEQAKGYTEEEIKKDLEDTGAATVGFDKVPKENRTGHARILKAYRAFVKDNHIGALASRCWPDFFTAYGTPVCTVLSMLNDEGVASACEADIYGALSMWVGMRLSGSCVFFGDPVSLDEKENTVTFWHCGAGACSLARKDTGAVLGVHPNRRIGPVMDFGCASANEATIFRIGRLPEGEFRFFIAEGSVPDKPKQFEGTSIVVQTEMNSRLLVEQSVRDGFEPHFVVILGRYGDALEALADMYGFPVYRY